MYTVYAGLEYLLVVTNLLYHATGVCEFGDARFMCVVPATPPQPRDDAAAKQH